jgi:hypothetical protein
MKSIFDQLNSNEEERIIVGVKCLKALNDKRREFLNMDVKSLLKSISTLVRSENDKIKMLSMDFLVSILSNWVGKERETLGMLCIHLLYKIEEEENYIILRLLNCLKILLSKNDIKVDEKNYIRQVLLLLSHKDVEVKIQAIETLTLSKDIGDLVFYLDKEKFIMEKIMMCLMVNDDRVKKSFLNFLLILLSHPYDNMPRLISENKVQDIILEEIQNQLPKGMVLESIVNEMACSPEYQILNMLNQVHQIVLFTISNREIACNEE